MSKESIYYQAFKKAYENNELYELFSKNEKYIYDNNGRLLISPDLMSFPDEDSVINYPALIMNGAVYHYFELDENEREEFKTRFCNAIIRMAESESIEQLYDATQIYFVLAEQEKENGDYFSLKGYATSLRNILREKVVALSEELKGFLVGPEYCKISAYDRIVEKQKRLD